MRRYLYGVGLDIPVIHSGGKFLLVHINNFPRSSIAVFACSTGVLNEGDN